MGMLRLSSELMVLKKLIERMEAENRFHLTFRRVYELKTFTISQVARLTDQPPDLVLDQCKFLEEIGILDGVENTSDALFAHFMLATPRGFEMADIFRKLDLIY
jgi:hypothetical protein